MRLLLLPALLVSAHAAEMKPGLIVKATDGELTVHFVAVHPNVKLDGNESIHPQLKPAFRAELNGYVLLENAGDYKFPEAPSVRIDGKECAGQTVNLPAGQRRIQISVSRAGTEPLALKLPFVSYVHDREPRELKEDQSRDLGRELFENLNCGACHREGPLPYRFTPLTDAPKAKSLRSLHPTEGCIAETPEENVPKFELNDAQREALQLFLQTPDISPAPLVDFPRQLKQFGCANCHVNLTEFKINLQEALLDHPGLTISTNDAVELTRNFEKVTP
jgi:hypothetical protein